MEDSVTHKTVRFPFKSIAAGLGLSVACIGVIAILGWFLGSRALTAIHADYIPMAPNTALLFLLLGVGLAGLERERRWMNHAVRLGASLVFLVAFVRFLEYVTSIDVDVDHWLFTFPGEHLGLAPVGRMGFFTAMDFIYAAAALLLLACSAERTAQPWAAAFVILTLIIGLVFALGYAYGSPLLYGGTTIPMALSTSVAFVLSGLGLLTIIFGREAAERQRAREALMEAHAELELQVHERTKELTATNEALRAEIAGRQQVEAALRESQKRLRDLIDGLGPSMFVGLMTPDGTVIEANWPALAAAGLKPEDVLGKPFEETYWWAYSEEVKQQLRAAIARAAHGDTSRYDVQIRAAQDQFIIIDFSLQPLWDETGKVVFLVPSGNVITERKKLEDELRALNAELEQRVIERTAEFQAANQELDAFTYSVSHDLRAPLRAISGFSRILLDEHAPELTPDAQSYLRRVNENSTRMGGLIDDLLAFSRLGRRSLKRESVSVHNLVREVLAELSQEQGGRRIDLRIGELPPCQADPALLKQLFVNLLANALKFTRRRAVAVIEIGCLDSDKSTERVYFVKDNGVGFDMRYAKKLFDVFERMHNTDEYEGTGVGLALVQRIVQRHGGRVWAEAEADKGATFYFTLREEATADVTTLSGNSAG